MKKQISSSKALAKSLLTKNVRKVQKVKLNNEQIKAKADILEAMSNHVYLSDLVLDELDKFVLRVF